MQKNINIHPTDCEEPQYQQKGTRMTFIQTTDTGEISRREEDTVHTPFKFTLLHQGLLSTVMTVICAFAAIANMHH